MSHVNFYFIISLSLLVIRYLYGLRCLYRIELFINSEFTLVFVMDAIQIMSI